MTGFRWKTVDDGEPALFGVEELTRPIQGTGRLSGLEFLHVAAKRVINRVPGESRVPFRWTINTYRGCSHACVYCLSGETPILMADGRTKPLADVDVGDRVYGTQRQGHYRRYVPTTVLAHWRTEKLAYRVCLEDGTELIASGDHRFLTERGWKHVAPADASARRQRPFLTPNNSLLGVGHLAATPAHDDDYRQGYLTGMIRGDAHVGTYTYDRPGRGPSVVHRFRLALIDREPLDRTRHFLELAGVMTTTLDFTPATATRAPLTAIGASAKGSVDAIRDIIRWPSEPSSQWRLGFLAGIFDAEGSHSHGVLRISNSDDEILRRVVADAEHFGFSVVLEGPRSNGVSTVRLVGGLRERLRFMLLTDPATTRKRCFDGYALTSDAKLRVVSVEPLGRTAQMFDITTGTGDFIADGVVSHNCFARPTHEYLGLNIGEDFDRRIVVKINAVERVRAELADPRWSGERIAMGTNTDPYQRAEAKYRLTGGVVEALAERRNPFSILTKSPSVTRDLDVIAEAAKHADVTVNFSIGTLDQDVWRRFEPGTPNPRRRLDAMARFAAAGVRTGALVAPVLPGISDSAEQLRAVVDAVRDTGGELLGVMPLHLRGPVREHVFDWLREHDPQRHADYVRRYGRDRYAPQRYVDELYRRAGVERRGRGTD